MQDNTLPVRQIRPAARVHTARGHCTYLPTQYGHRVRRSCRAMPAVTARAARVGSRCPAASRDPMAVRLSSGVKSSMWSVPYTCTCSRAAAAGRTPAHAHTSMYTCAASASAVATRASSGRGATASSCGVPLLLLLAAVAVMAAVHVARGRRARASVCVGSVLVASTSPHEGASQGAEVNQMCLRLDGGRHRGSTA